MLTRPTNLIWGFREEKDLSHLVGNVRIEVTTAVTKLGGGGRFGWKANLEIESEAELNVLTRSKALVGFSEAVFCFGGFSALNSNRD